jgi:photosystem II stability/assembly factor-like uncharacterized protein
MLRYFNLCVLIFAIPISLFAQNWHSIEPRVTDETLFSISFCDSMHGWAVGENGIVLHSNDGGSRWELQQSGVTDTLLDISFGDSLNGMAVGNNSVMLKTEDDGKTWQKLKKRWDTLGQTFTLKQVNYFGKDTCWILNDAWLYYTFNGGTTWHDTGFAYKRVIDVCFKNSQTFWALSSSNGTSYKTSDGGKNFDSLQRPVFSMDTVLPREWKICNIQFINDSIGWISNISGYLTSTNDGGISWKQLTIVDTHHTMVAPLFLIQAFHFTTPSSGVVLSSYPERILYRTADGGTTWTRDPSFTRAPEYLYKLYYDKNGNGWAVGEFGVIYTNKKTNPIAVSHSAYVPKSVTCKTRITGNMLIITNSNEIASVSLFDLSGRAVLFRRINNGLIQREGNVILDLPSLSRGGYICSIIDQTGMRINRIIQKLQ